MPREGWVSKTTAAFGLWNDSEQKGITNVAQMFPLKNVSKKAYHWKWFTKGIQWNWEDMFDIMKNDAIEYNHIKLEKL